MHARHLAPLAPLALIGLLGCMVNAPAPTSPASASTLPPGAEDGVDRQGSDLKDFDTPEPKACFDACAADAACKAWTFTRVGTDGHATAKCWLKNGVPEPTKKDGCVSGVKK